MITVQEIELPLRFPSTSLHMVLMQPHIEFETPYREPYKWSPQARATQLQAIRRTLELAAEAHPGSRTHFTVFPEYCVPGLNGVDLINEIINGEGWPKESIIIAGIDGLTKEEYSILCSPQTTYVDLCNAPDRVRADQWVNCCVTWLKDMDGRCFRWVQPKIRPSKLEHMTPCSDMFLGSSVFLFKCSYDRADFYPCRFFSLICFDWVAKIDGMTVQEAVLSNLSEIWAKNPTHVHWVFVLEQNNQPNHHTFLDSTYEFLVDDSSKFPIVDRRDAAVVLANNAARKIPCRNGNGFGGFTAIVFHPSAPFDCSACRPTVCMQPANLRGEDKLSLCKDIVFREMGSCIHSFKVRVPRFVTPNPTDRTYPVSEASVFSIADEEDPRLPGGPVPASVKWVNDDIDEILDIGSEDMRGVPLQEGARHAHSFVVSNLRYIMAQGLMDRIRLALATENRNFNNVDEWGMSEHQALEHMIYTLSAFGICYDLSIVDSTLHGTLRLPLGICQIVAVRGNDHEECRRHFDESNKFGGRMQDPVILITRDRSNLKPTEAELSTIFDSFVATGLRCKDYQSLVDTCRRAESKEQLREALNDLFKPCEQPII